MVQLVLGGKMCLVVQGAEMYWKEFIVYVQVCFLFIFSIFIIQWPDSVVTSPVYMNTAKKKKKKNPTNSNDIIDT